MIRQAVKRNSGTASESRAVQDGIHFFNAKREGHILSADYAVDADGVIKKDPRLLDYCRRIAFMVFGSDVSYKEGYKYTINEAIGEKLGTVRGYNTGPEPMQAIIAVNRLTGAGERSIMGIDIGGLSPQKAFTKILAQKNPAVILDHIRSEYLNPSDIRRTEEMFHFYHVDPGLYKHHSMARLMRPIGGSVEALAYLSRHCRENGRRLSIVTDTPDQTTLVRHLEAVGFPNGVMDTLLRDTVLITQKDVTERKPHPEGLQKAKRPDVPLLYIGDTARDGEAAQRAREEARIDVEFAAVLSGGSGRETFEPFNPVMIAKDLRSVARFHESRRSTA